MLKNIYCDFDGVISNTIAVITKLYNEDFKYYNNFHSIKWEDVNTWDFTELNCASTGYVNTYFNQQRFFDNIEYIPWAKEMLFQLSESYNITIVSSGFSPNLKAKEVWIRDNLPFANFIGVNLKQHKDKSYINMSDGIFIDDSMHNLETSSAAIKICFGDSYPWNEKWIGTRCYNWHDVKNYLEKNVIREGENNNELD